MTAVQSWVFAPPVINKAVRSLIRSDTSPQLLITPQGSCDNKDQCPEEGSNDQPKCSDESCLGQKDGKCTVGDHKDCSCGKEQCPKEGDQQPSCKDESCKAKDGKCTEGEHKDCECKNTCPKTEEEEVPKCSDEKCQGVNTGKCTADGDLKDCECVKRECPDLKKEIFFCSQCGGKNEQDKCKGVRTGSRISDH